MTQTCLVHPPTHAVKQRIAFSERLQEVLNKNGYSPDSPTYLAREFNLRFTGNPVTVHAARKWLIGEVVPTQEKLRILADWLNVPIEWLRFGTKVDTHTISGEPYMAYAKLCPTHLKIMESLHNLNEEQCELLHRVILNMVRPM